MCDGCDDIYDSGCGAENIVTSSHRHIVAYRRKMQRVSLCFSCGL
nr:MAG TPA: protein of unknown function DUF282 [Caudoviricetes sp.]